MGTSIANLVELAQTETGDRLAIVDMSEAPDVTRYITIDNLLNTWYEDTNVGTFSLIFTETTVPSTPSANTGKLYSKDVGGNTHPFWIDENANEFDLTDTGGGGSQTPWTSDIDADGFDLKDLSNVEFRQTTGLPASTVGYIAYDIASDEMVYNVASADSHHFYSGGSSLLELTNGTIFCKEDLDMGGKQLENLFNIRMDTNTPHSIFMDRPANVADGTTVGIVRMRARDGGLINQTDYAMMYAVMESDVDAAEEGSMNIAVQEAGVSNVDYMSFNGVSSNVIDAFRTLDMNDNEILFSAQSTGLGDTQYWIARESVAAVDTLTIHSGDNIRFETSTGARYVEFAESTQIFQIHFPDVSLDSGTRLKWANSAQRAIINDTSGFEFRVQTGDTFECFINDVSEYEFSSTQLDVKSNNIVNLPGNFINALTTVTPVATDMVMIYDATDGNLKKVDADDFLGGGSQTPWTSNIDAANFNLNNLDTLDFNGVGSSIVQVETITMNQNGVISAFDRLEQDTTSGPISTIGALRMRNGQHIGWRNAGDTDSDSLQVSSSSLNWQIGGVSKGGFTCSNAEFNIRNDLVEIQDPNGIVTLELNRNSELTADTVIGHHDFRSNIGEEGSGVWARAIGTVEDATGASEDGSYKLAVMEAGTENTVYMALNDAAAQQIDFLRTVSIADAQDIVIGTTTGSKIGTATSQKIGFWNATPLVQQSVASDTLANLYTLLRAIGIVA